MDPYIEQMHAPLVFRIESADIREGTSGLDHHGDPVELVVPRVEDVPAQTAAPKCLSNAFTRSPAIA